MSDRYRPSSLVTRVSDSSVAARWFDVSDNSYDLKPFDTATTGYSYVAGTDAAAPNGHGFLSRDLVSTFLTLSRPLLPIESTAC